LEFPALCTVLLDWEDVKTAADVNVVVDDIFWAVACGRVLPVIVAMREAKNKFWPADSER